MIAWIWMMITILVYLTSKRLYSRWKKVWLSPLIVTPTIVIFLLGWTHIDYTVYNQGGSLLTSLLGPATVAFAIPIYQSTSIIRRYAKVLFASLLIGSLFALLATVFLGWLTHLDPLLLRSVLPRSITTPIAMEMSQSVGGIPSLTAVFVMVTGVFGSTFGPTIIRWSKVRNPISRGMMMGMGAHGTGTAKAFELGEREGVFSSLSMIIAAILTILWGMGLDFLWM